LVGIHVRLVCCIAAPFDALVFQRLVAARCTAVVGSCHVDCRRFRNLPYLCRMLRSVGTAGNRTRIDPKRRWHALLEEAKKVGHMGTRSGLSGANATGNIAESLDFVSAVANFRFAIRDGSCPARDTEIRRAGGNGGTGLWGGRRSRPRATLLQVAGWRPAAVLTAGHRPDPSLAGVGAREPEGTVGPGAAPAESPAPGTRAGPPPGPPPRTRPGRRGAARAGRGPPGLEPRARAAASGGRRGTDGTPGPLQRDCRQHSAVGIIAARRPCAGAATPRDAEARGGH
jgi:hypothetical protein